MKRWLIAALLPLVLVQAPAFAQSDLEGQIDSPSNAQQEAPSQSVIANPEITLIPLKGTAQIQLQLVNCSGWLDCSLARLLLPASAYINQRQLQFENLSSTPVSILNNAVVLEGALTNYQLTENAISISEDVQSLPANRITSLPLILNRSAMPPDQYGGAVYLTLTDQGDRLVLPVIISVRNGPLLPMLVLFLGVVLGGLIKYMQERGEPQSNALTEFNRLKQDIEDAELPDEDRAALDSMADRVQKMVDRHQLETANAEIATIRNRLEILTKLPVIEAKVQQEPLDSNSEKEIREQLSKAHYYIIQGNNAKCDEALEQVDRILESAGITTKSGTPEDLELKNTIDSTRAATKCNAKDASLSQEPSSASERFQQFLIDLSEVCDRVRAEATLWVARPLLSLALLIGLSAVGIGSLYVENGTTFGAKPFSDYFALILWGLSADVASRSLSNLKGTKD